MHERIYNWYTGTLLYFEEIILRKHAKKEKISFDNIIVAPLNVASPLYVAGYEICRNVDDKCRKER